MTPEDLARDVGISPKALRSWLRSTFPRSPVDKHQRWSIDAAMAEQAREQFLGRAGS